MVPSFKRLACVLGLVCLGGSRLSQALPSGASDGSGDLASLLLARSVASDNTTSSINTNNTADCTNCTNLGNFDNPVEVSSTDPVVQVRNGSYAGLTIPPIAGTATLSGFGTNGSQEAFLGIPYAQQPVEALRFQRPASLNESWTEVRSAKRYSEHCFGVGTDDDYNPPYVTYKHGERCLTLNVVRPTNVSQSTEAKLPVFVWVHGGGFSYGGSGDRRYNGSFIVDRAVELGQPLIFVSLNYRVSVLGFPVGDEASQARVQNLGLYDQRLALQWIRENIGGFGGDKDRVTIVGESAGGASMFFHLAAYGGRDDGLFRSVAVESGYWATGLDTQNTTATRNEQWSSLAQAAGCGSNRALDCLRSVPLETIKQWSTNHSASISVFNPVVDGDLVAKDLQRSFLEGEFVKTAAVLLNNNLDEGLSFGVRGVNTTRDILTALDASQALPDGWSSREATSDLARIYPDNEDVYPPFQAGAGLLPPSKVLGINDRRSCAIFGDLRFVGPRRQATELLVRSSTAPIYASRFDQLSYKSPITNGAQHFQEVAYVFRNPLDSQNALGPLDKDVALANEMSAYWISFAATGDPNTARNQRRLRPDAPYWPKYDERERSHLAWVYDGSGHRSFVTPDTYRQKGIQLLMALRSASYSPADFQQHSKRDEL